MELSRRSFFAGLGAVLAALPFGAAVARKVIPAPPLPDTSGWYASHDGAIWFRADDAYSVTETGGLYTNQKYPFVGIQTPWHEPNRGVIKLTLSGPTGRPFTLTKISIIPEGNATMSV